MTGLRPHLRAVAAFSATALALAACSSDDDDPGGVTTSVPGVTTTVGTATTAPAATTTVGATTTPTTPAPTTTNPGRATTGGGANGPRVQFTPVLNVEGNDVGRAVDLATRRGDPALYVVAQEGRITRVVDGTPTGTVLDLAGRTTASGERGLLGLAFAPDGSKAYVYYTASNGGNVVVAEYSVDADGTFDPESRRELLSIRHPLSNHNGGALRFGPDGLLYIGTGDGGSGGDPDRRALDTGDLLGKILRIDPTPSTSNPYTIPRDNPFVGVDGARPELWSIGLRNPWRISFDRVTGDLWIADVGQNRWEEINVVFAEDGRGRGASFGWSAREGAHPFNADQSAEGAVDPVSEYAHGDDGCSISGGVRYRGAANPTLAGWYVYGDFCSGRVWGLALDETGAARETVRLGGKGNIAAVAEDGAGELYVLTLDGPVMRLDP